MFRSTSLLLSVARVLVRIEVLFPFWSIGVLMLTQLLLLLQEGTLLSPWNSLFGSVRLVYHVEFLHIYALNIKLDSGSIWLLLWGFHNCAISLTILWHADYFASRLRNSVCLTVVGFRTRPMSRESRSELVKLGILVLEQQRTLLPILSVFLFSRPKILFGVISSLPDLLFVFASQLPVSLAYSFGSCDRGGISWP